MFRFLSAILFLLMPSALNAGLDDHFANIQISVIHLGVDPENSDRTALGLSLENPDPIDLILRGMITNYGEARFRKVSKIFGTEIMSEPPFIAIPSEATTEIAPPEFWFSIDESFAPDKYYGFGLDFGPYGQVFYEINRPEDF